MGLISVIIGICVFAVSMLATIIGIALFAWPLWYLVIPFVWALIAVAVSFTGMVLFTRN